MRHLQTIISLPPGAIPSPVIHGLLRTIFEQYQWFRPERYGFAALDGRLNPTRIDYDALLAQYEDLSSITIAAQTDRDFLLLSVPRPGVPPHVGKIDWMASATSASKPAWRTAHLRQVVEIMRMLKSPLAQAGVDDDVESKKWRWVPDGISNKLTFNVRDPSEGLAGLFWRNFFGPPFVELFGERLAILPSEFKQELGDGIVLVQPYELPSQAGSPEALERERQLIAHLGPECFYDHSLHLKPTRLPHLSPPPT
jgi:hypothetical protein